MAANPATIAPPAAAPPAADPNAAIYDALRKADAAGDADAVARLSLYLKQQPAQLVDGHTMGFADEAPVEAQSAHMTPEQEQSIVSLAQDRKSTADDLRRLAAKYGHAITNADDIIKARDQGAGVNNTVMYPLPKPTTDNTAESLDGAGSARRGIWDTLGAVPKIAAAIEGVGSAATGGSFSKTYYGAMDEANGLKQYDEEQHPIYRIAGQLLGSLPIPVGLEGVGYKAGAAALREGASMQEARAIAAAAVRNRLTTTGGAIGAAHGALSADNIPDAVKGGLVEGALGAAGGLGFGVAGEVAAPRLAANAAARRAAGVLHDADYAAIADRLGISPTPATTGGPVAHATQLALGNTPGGMAAVAGAVDKENAGLAGAAKRAAETIGTVDTREGAGDAIVQGSSNYAQSSKNQGTALYDLRDAAFGGKSAPVDAKQTRGAFQDIADNFPTSAAVAQLSEHPALRKLLDAVTVGKPLTLGEATEALSHVRGVQRSLAAKADATGPVLARVAKVEQALEDDVMAAAENADKAAGRVPGAPGSAVAAQKDADAFWADRKAALNGALKTARASAKDNIKVSGEQVFNQVSADMNRVGGNLKRLRETWFRLPEDARKTFAATKLDDMGRSLPGAQNDRGDAWSFNRFLTNFDAMSPQARRITFGADVEPQIRDIAAYASRLRDLDKSRNFSNTAKHLISGGILTALGNAAVHGNFMQAGEIAGATAALWPTAKLFLATPAMRAWTKSALRIGLVQSEPRAHAQGQVLVRKLSAIARAEPAIANDVLQLQSRLSQMLESGGSAPLAAQDKKNGAAVPPKQQPDDPAYHQWLQKYGIREDPTYDTRAAFQHGLTPDARGHLNDAYKLPTHPTFSDESIHNGEGGKAGGKWVQTGPAKPGMPEGQWAFKASDWNLRNMSKPQLKAYFDKVEPGNVIIFPDGEHYRGKEQ